MWADCSYTLPKRVDSCIIFHPYLNAVIRFRVVVFLMLGSRFQSTALSARPFSPERRVGRVRQPYARRKPSRTAYLDRVCYGNHMTRDVLEIL